MLPRTISDSLATMVSNESLPRFTPMTDSTSKPDSGARSREAKALLETLRPDLLRFACWLCRDQALAEDVVQETLLRAWRSRDSLSDVSAARAWLMTIVRREHARLYRRKRWQMVEIDAAIEDEHPALALDDSSEHAGLHDALLQLPVEYRVPLLMQVIGGFTAEEIGRELNLTQTAVLTRLFRARNRLRAAYGLTATAAPDSDSHTLVRRAP